MELHFQHIADILLNLDLHLGALIQSFPQQAYGLISLLMFMEPGFFMSFLPGDTVIFLAATMAASDRFNYLLLWLVVIGSSLLGDSLNYGLGCMFRGYLANKTNHRWIKMEHLDKTRLFYERYGGKTILLSRYIPVVRVFAPFFGGLGALPYRTFFKYDIVAILIWSALYVNLGFFFGALPWVQDNLVFVLPVVAIATMIPTLIVTLLTRPTIQA